MPISIATLADEVRPHSTVLLFGAGSSLPSGAPSVGRVKQALSKEYGQDFSEFSLSDASGIIEQKTRDRKRLIATLRSLFKSLRPTGGLLNLPLYDWKSIFTTNYDELIEASYARSDKSLYAYSSNFDFTGQTPPGCTKLFKLHGTIGQDISDGNVAKLILTDLDYESTEDYREYLYDRLRADLAGSRLVIIGHSLADADIRAIVTRAIAINAKALSAGRITLLMYERNDDLAALFEGRGLQVAFGGIDEFFAAMAKQHPDFVLAHPNVDDPLSASLSLLPVTTDVAHSIAAGEADVSAMFNGWPATHADIAAGLTFDRTVSDAISQFLQSSDDSRWAVLLGASGVGKTTAARQALQRLRSGGIHCWEHNSDHPLSSAEWSKVADALKRAGSSGVLFVDDAHAHMQQINDLIDALSGRAQSALRIIVSSSRNSWRPRVKTPNLFKYGREFVLSKLDNPEIERLLQLVDNHPEIRPLVENSFSGFSRHERQRRLVERCESDMFVCLKNIFAFEKFDDIILREYAALGEESQHIYRLIAALESAGVRVHRQLVIRLLGIPAQDIQAYLTHLTDIVNEYSINESEGIYGWRGRHPVITSIVAKYKFNDNDKLIDLFEKVIDSISPTYDIEIRSLRDLCTVQRGISRFADRRIQNRLLRRMMSAAPGERVPRHRLIRNLIEMGEYDQAQTEMRIFDRDFGRDGPVVRYKINLMVARATRSPGIMIEDRLAILSEARDLGAGAARKYQNNVQILSAYCDVGIEIYRLSGKLDVFDDAIREFKQAEARVGDPEIGRIAARYERRLAGHSVGSGAGQVGDLQPN